MPSAKAEQRRAGIFLPQESRGQGQGLFYRLPCPIPWPPEDMPVWEAADDASASFTARNGSRGRLRQAWS